MKLIEINLIPPEEVPESPYTIRNIATLVISFVIAIGLILLTLQMSNLKSEYAQQKMQLLERLEVYSRQKENIDDLQKKKADLEQRYKLITEVLGQRITWYDKLSDMHRRIPEDVWLSQIVMEIKKTEDFQTEKRMGVPVAKESSELRDLGNVHPIVLFHILGYTLELSEIGGLIDELNDSPFFEKTGLQKIDKAQIKNRPVISFEITTQMNGSHSKLLSKVNAGR
jgi:hypothetical protein